MQSLVLRITIEDINDAMRYGVQNPILFGLQRATGTLWRFYDDGLAIEAMAPYRACRISSEMVRFCHQHHGISGLTQSLQEKRSMETRRSMEGADSRHTAPFEVVLELCDTRPQEGYSLRQRRESSVAQTSFVAATHSSATQVTASALPQLP